MGRGENKVADKDGSLRGEREQPERSAGVYQRAKIGDIHRGRRSDSAVSGTKKTPKKTQHSPEPSIMSERGRYISRVCSCLALKELKK